MKRQGVVKKVKLIGIKKDTFAYRTDKAGNLNASIQNALKKAIRNGLFF